MCHRSPATTKHDCSCIYHIATRLGLKDPNNTPYKCPHGVAECRYRHVALNKIQRDKAEKAVKNCSDLTFRALLLTGIAAAPSTTFL